MSARSRVALRTDDGRTVVENCELADTMVSRMVGLLGRTELKPRDGLWIIPCNSIHMFFMRFPIDAVFLAKDGSVVRLAHDLQPWAAVWPVKGAHSVVELPAGSILQSGIAIGDRLVPSSDKQISPST